MGLKVERLVAELASQELSDDELIDAAAELASRHPALQGDAERIRSLIALQASRNRIVNDVAGGPRVVIEREDPMSSTSRQAVLAGEAIRQIWQEEMLGPAAAATALGAKPSNREKVRQYRARSKLIGLPRERGYLYPAFQFDKDRRQVRPEVQRANEILDARDDPWGVASWWISRNARLGAKPMELIGTNRSEDIVRAAEAVVEPVG